jgi:predicted alpha/beta hydrolase family esterase
LAVAHWANAYPEKTSQIQSALMVAPPDVGSLPHIPDALRRFAAHNVIPFPSVLVGSEDDHYMTLDSARELAGYWNSRFVNAGAVGHINLDSGHGPWPEGEAMLKDLIRRD